MPYPGFNFLLGAFTPAQQAELEQFAAYLQGYLEVDHVDAGTHGNIRAKSLSLIANTATGATGDLAADGDGDFDGAVTAAADSDPVILNDFGGGIGSGIDLRDGTTALNSRWRIASVESSTARTLQFIDVLEAALSYVFRIHRRDSGGSGSFNYYLSPESTVGLSLGQDSSGLRIDDIFALAMKANGTITANSGYFERLRSVALGEWADIAYNAANFTADSGTWGVDSADVTALRYSRIGKTVLLNFDIRASDVSATPNNLSIALPVTAGSKGTRTTFTYSDAGGAVTVGRAIILANGTTLDLFKLSGTWSLTSADDTAVLGQIFYEAAS